MYTYNCTSDRKSMTNLQCRLRHGASSWSSCLLKRRQRGLWLECESERRPTAIAVGLLTGRHNTRGHFCRHLRGINSLLKHLKCTWRPSLYLSSFPDGFCQVIVLLCHFLSPHNPSLALLKRHLLFTHEHNVYFSLYFYESGFNSL